MKKAPIIQAQKLAKVYSSGRIEVTAVKDIDLAVEATAQKKSFGRET
ncbi:MAG: hypothetical protein WBE11_04880 [Candidatus Aminicenantaceae bacterium]